MLLKTLRVARVHARDLPLPCFLGTHFRVTIHSRAASSSSHTLPPSEHRQQNTVIILTGATATGKSSAAEYLCTQHPHHNLHNYEIVVADSVQVMRLMDIGSNKPTAAERAAIPHHMVDIHAPGLLYSAGEYCQGATEVIVDIIRRGKVPLVVGGNTMWVDWLIKGAPNAPKGCKKVKIQAAELLAPFMTEEEAGGLATDTADTAHTETDLSAAAAAAAPLSMWRQATAEVDRRREALLATGELAADVASSVEMAVTSNDWYRLHRLLEIILTLQNDIDAKYASRHDASYTLSSDERDGRVTRFQGLEAELKTSAGIEIDLKCFFLGGERISLYRSIDQRCVAMLMDGLLEEVTELYLKQHIVQLPRHTSGYAATKSSRSPSSPPSSSSSASVASPTASTAIGYRQTVNYLCRLRYKDKDAHALMEYIEHFATATRNYAKRQLHWYRKDPNFLWLHDTSKVEPTSGVLTGKKHQPCRASRRIAEEVYYWAYEFCRAQEFANSEEMKDLKNKTHLLKAKFNKCDKKSGESYLLRSCEGALDRDALKRYTSHCHTSLTTSQVDTLCSLADSCRRQISDMLT